MNHQLVEGVHGFDVLGNNVNLDAVVGVEVDARSSLLVMALE